jgi:membrane associated rhomboid family serine protease
MQHAPRPVIVYALVCVNLCAFVIELLAGNPVTLIRDHSTIPYVLTHGTPAALPLALLTLLTTMFIHAGFFHIFFNMLFLVVFGPKIEIVCGHARFFALYLTCGIIGELAVVGASPDSHVGLIGASAAVAGVLGAFLITFPRATVNTIVPIGWLPIFFRLPAVVVIGVWLASQFAHGFDVLMNHASNTPPSHGYLAHLVGFGVGMLLVRLMHRPDAPVPT